MYAIILISSIIVSVSEREKICNNNFPLCSPGAHCVREEIVIDIFSSPPQPTTIYESRYLNRIESACNVENELEKI